MYVCFIILYFFNHKTPHESSLRSPKAESETCIHSACLETPAVNLQGEKTGSFYWVLSKQRCSRIRRTYEKKFVADECNPYFNR